MRPSECSVSLLDAGRCRRDAVLSWNSLLVQSSWPARVAPVYWFCAPAAPFALAPAVRFFADGLHRSHLSDLAHPLFELRVSSECSSANPSRQTAVDRRLSWALFPFSTYRIRRSTCRGRCLRPLRSAFRVWLPSWRLSPAEPAPALFRAGSAPGIHPSEFSPRGRYPAPFGPEEPTYRFSDRYTNRLAAKGRPGRPRFLGFDPSKSSLRSPRD